MFVNRSERRSWSELTTKEIVTQLFAVWFITTPMVVFAIDKLLSENNGIEWFYLGFAGFVLSGGGSVTRGAIIELRQRRKQQEAKSHDNDDDK